MIELRRCPFCGGKPRTWIRSVPTCNPIDGDIFYNGYVSCTSCTAKVRSLYQHPTGPEAVAEAVRTWNRRQNGDGGPEA